MARPACWIGRGLFIGTTVISATAALAQEGGPGATAAPVVSGPGNAGPPPSTAAPGQGPESTPGAEPTENQPPGAGTGPPTTNRGQAWLFQPSVALDETFTDNARSTATRRAADAITTATPRFFATGEAPRLQGVFDYSPQFIDYAVATDQNRINQNLFTSGTLTAIPDRLFFDAHASASDLSRTGDRGFGNATVVPSNLDTRNYSFSGSPYARFHLADKGDAEVRYTYSQTIFSGNTGTIATAGVALPPISNGIQQDGLVKFVTDPEISRLQLTTEGEYTDYAGGTASSRHALGNVNGSYPVTRSLYALLGAGYERLTYQFQPSLDFTGPSWNFGAKYQPNPDQLIQLTYGESEGQLGFAGQMNYQLTASTSIFASYSEQNSSAQQQLLQNLNSANELTPGNVVNQSTGLPTNIANPNLSLQNNITRTKTLQGGARIITGGLNSYTLTFNHTEDQALLGVGQTSNGGILTWGHEITPDRRTTVSGGYSTNTQTAVVGTGGANGDTITVGLSYDYDVSQSLFLSARYDLFRSTGGGTGTILTNLVSLSIRKTY